MWLCPCSPEIHILVVQIGAHVITKKKKKRLLSPAEDKRWQYPFTLICRAVLCNMVASGYRWLFTVKRNKIQFKVQLLICTSHISSVATLSGGFQIGQYRIQHVHHLRKFYGITPVQKDWWRKMKLRKPYGL